MAKDKKIRYPVLTESPNNEDGRFAQVINELRATIETPIVSVSNPVSGEQPTLPDFKPRESSKGKRGYPLKSLM